MAGKRYIVGEIHNVKVFNKNVTRYYVRDTVTGKLVGQSRPPYYETKTDADIAAYAMNKEE